MTVKHPTLDLSILVLDAQALPLGNGQCNNCVGYNGKISGSKANAIGMGRAAQSDRSYADNLQEISTTQIAISACNSARNPPAGMSAWQRALWNLSNVFTGNLDATSLCTQDAGKGVCVGDQGGPLVMYAPPSPDQLWGISKQVWENCDGSEDPSVYTDVTTDAVRRWIDNVILSVTPLGAPAVGNTPMRLTRNPVADPNIPTVYNYEMKMTWWNLAGNAAATCEQLDLINTAGRFWPRFNRNFLEKRARSYIAGGLVDSWFGAHPTSCVNTAAGAVMKWEWSSSRDPVAMAATMSAKMNDPAGQAGQPADIWQRAPSARFWAMWFRCQITVPNRTNYGIVRFDINSGKGAWKVPVGSWSIPTAGYPAVVPAICPASDFD